MTNERDNDMRFANNMPEDNFLNKVFLFGL